MQLISGWLTQCFRLLQTTKIPSTNVTVLQLSIAIMCIGFAFSVLRKVTGMSIPGASIVSNFVSGSEYAQGKKKEKELKQKYGYN